jgi:hypothetical protein
MPGEISHLRDLEVTSVVARQLSVVTVRQVWMHGKALRCAGFASFAAKVT